jgi:serine/threonine protein phosphatase PrpC
MALDLEVGVCSKNFRHSVNEDNYLVMRGKRSELCIEYLKFYDFANKVYPDSERARLASAGKERILFSHDSELYLSIERLELAMGPFFSENRLFAVLDGVTGRFNPYSENRVYSFPEIATTIAVEELISRFKIGRTDMLQMLKEADLAIAKEVEEYKKMLGCKNFVSSSVATFALVQPEKLTVAHFGDTSLFLMRENRLKQVTERQELGASPSVYLGHGAVEPVISEQELCRGDIIVLCSDGVTAPFTETGIERNAEGNLCLSSKIDIEAIQDMLRSENNCQKASEKLVCYSKLKGNGDDATAVVIKYS